VIISLVGILFFKENLNALKAVSIILIVLGVIGINLSGVSHSG
jgi:small multidrug resistance pump